MESKEHRIWKNLIAKLESIGLELDKDKIRNMPKVVYKDLGDFLGAYIPSQDRVYINSDVSNTLKEFVLQEEFIHCISYRHSEETEPYIYELEAFLFGPYLDVSPKLGKELIKRYSEMVRLENNINKSYEFLSDVAGDEILCMITDPKCLMDATQYIGYCEVLLNTKACESYAIIARMIGHVIKEIDFYSFVKGNKDWFKKSSEEKEKSLLSYLKRHENEVNTLLKASFGVSLYNVLEVIDYLKSL